MNINIKYMGLAALAMASLSACDLDTTPTTSLDSDNAFKSTTYAEDVLRAPGKMPWTTASPMPPTDSTPSCCKTTSYPTA